VDSRIQSGCRHVWRQGEAAGQSNSMVGVILRAAELLWYASSPLASRVLPERLYQELARRRHRYLPRTETRGEWRVKQSLRPCDQLECIFVHIPKAAGNSVTRSLFGCGVGHRSIHEYRGIFGEDFQSYFKFTVVRNPFTRVVSAYEFLKQGGHPAWPNDGRYRDEVLCKYSGFESFVLEKLNEAIWEQKHFRPQAKFLMLGGELGVDFVARLETLEEDFEFICEQLGVDRELPHRNKTRGHRPPLASYYERDEVANTVRTLYADDFSLLGYSRQVPRWGEAGTK